MIPEANQVVMISLEDVVPENHFLRRMARLFPWEEWAIPFEKVFKGEKEYGPAGYPTSVLLKMIVLSFLYDLSDPQTEMFAKENNPARYFLGMGLLQRVPDETTLCRFRGRITKKGMDSLLADLFNKVLLRAHELGVEFGKVQILDSVHTSSKINKRKEDASNKQSEEKGEDIKPPTDPDASIGCKGKFKMKDPETGEVKEYKKWFYGYKSHVSLNQKTNLVTSVIISTGKDADVNASCFLLEDDIKKGLVPTVVVGDKAYDDINLYAFCGKNNIFPAVSLKKTRLFQKSTKIREKWEDHKKMPFYKKALKLRYKVEQKFGEAKVSHGFDVTRYIGIKKFTFQSIFTFAAMNLKRILKLVPFKNKMKLCSA